ncbi:hypothetical protein [Bdellovibrio sp. GT3]|uniref:hypothetical protein n=1 Tax=Bdellovibrio sp. GT3 TaxID=3136282 RepID=UPI0030F0EB86
MFQMQSGGAGVYTAKSTVNEKVIENRPVSREKYIAFANRVYDFAEKYNGSVATQDDCKSPFTIRMEKAGAVKDVQGCRGSDETGELGKIIREGEILFYSE